MEDDTAHVVVAPDQIGDGSGSIAPAGRSWPAGAARESAQCAQLRTGGSANGRRLPERHSECLCESRHGGRSTDEVAKHHGEHDPDDGKKCHDKKEVAVPESINSVMIQKVPGYRRDEHIRGVGNKSIAGRQSAHASGGLRTLSISREPLLPAMTGRLAGLQEFPQSRRSPNKGRVVTYERPPRTRSDVSRAVSAGR